MRKLALLVVLLCATITHASEVIVGRVVKVSDGDTITVLTVEKQQVKVRLHGIDAPESKQAFGEKSRLALAELVAGKDATVTVETKDRYGRVVGRVVVGKTDANLAQVAAGMAWWYRAYAKKDTALRDAESAAREARRGLWSDPNPVPPWDWRKQQKRR
jgi:Micrococcal nuclease (thermonuclease) homologs